MNNSVDYSQKVLEVKNLKKHFKVGVGKNKLKVKAVDDVSFDVYKNEVFGLVGESGCGKTTTGRTIIRLYEPTNGTVKLENEIVGAGVNDFFRDIKYRKKDYALELLKLNQYKYDVYLLKSKFEKQRNDILVKIDALNKKFTSEKKEVEKDIFNYRSTVFKEKNETRISLEKLTYDFNSKSEEILNKTRNEFLIEHKILLKGLNLSYKKKVEGIKESAALSKDVKKTHLDEIKVLHEEKVLKLQNEFAPKIEARNNTLTSKEDAKGELVVIKATYLQEKEKISTAHKDFIEKLPKPDYEGIKAQVSVLKEKYQGLVAVHKQEIVDLKSKLTEDISKVTSSKEVDKDKKAKIKADFDAFMDHQMTQVRSARAAHKSKDAEKHVKKIQMIFQDPISSLNPRMTVQEIVSEGLIINGEKDQEVIRKKVIDALLLVGLAPEYISRYPHEFSGGQRQRIGIARALVMNPSMIIADEPISALDVSIKAQVINLLSDLREKLGLTILFVAHDLSVVKFFCDRVAVMYFGKMVELATTEQLFSNPLHGYTKSLLSAIPNPDPDSEKTRKRIEYSATMHDYSVDKPEFVEVTKGHFVLANKAEVAAMRKELGLKDEK